MKRLNISALAVVTLISLCNGALSSEVVALGASNTYGRGQGRHPDGVSQPEAYPAQLEDMLRKRGCRVSVENAGVPGDTTEDMLHRLPEVIGADTRVLVLQTGGNDEREGSADMSGAIVQAASARKIRVVRLDQLGKIAGAYRLPDGQHFSAEGHAAMAAYLMPRVRSALRC